ncbi:MAG: hypothetical protein KAX20_03825 [Candidatus Omnitrophica bacterium]|nr:hypothetical protein [Candidatus Omnitrophota bacterium]
MRERSCTEWFELFEKKSFLSNLKRIYGNSELVKERKDFILKVLKKFAFHFGEEEKVAIVRVPSRVNIMGVHIEHRGCYVNYLTIQKEIITVASKRTDDKIRGFNIDGRFRPFSFSIKALLPPERRGNWLKFISESKISPGNWANYIKGPILRLQDFVRKELSGMDLVIGGNIPQGSGLSSSSALVVASALTSTAFNNLNLSKENLVRLCGEAEWYVGTRGGAGDHAAMLFGKKGYISHLRFFPFIVENVPLPSNYTIVICNSLKKAPKSKEARDVYNRTIANYEISLKLIKKNYPELSKKINYLRDVNKENLKVMEIKIYEILKSLPQRIKRKELLKVFPEQEMRKLFSTHSEPEDGYRPRGVALFALAECERSKITSELFKKKNGIKELGKLMYISHNGDRVVSFDKNGKKSFYEREVTDEYLEKLCKNLKDKKVVRSHSPSEASHPERSRRNKAQILFQPGDFRCSCEELDELVDISKRIRGVIGASLTGAGFGGAIVVLVRNREVKGFLREIGEKYYQAKGLPFAAEICISTAGAGILN